ncbi:MAG: AAA family ATPase [Gammaproteobacteria bacterium]|nr:AAA family ATPase [Gammaproteobacteria bacterium]
MNLILCGYKTCGKTTLARAYSQRIGYQMLDTDDLIIKAFSASKKHAITSIYQTLGEQGFRTLEADCVQNLKGLKNTIIATGGGTLLHAPNTKKLRALGEMIYLNVSSDVLLQRLSKLTPAPRFIDSDCTFKQYLKSRDDIYQKAADYVLKITHQSTDEIITDIHQYHQKRF